MADLSSEEYHAFQDHGHELKGDLSTVTFTKKGMIIKGRMLEVIYFVWDHVGRRELVAVGMVIAIGMFAFAHETLFIETWSRCIRSCSELGVYATVVIVFLCILSTCIGFPVDFFLVWSGAFFESEYGPITGAVVGIFSCCTGVYIGCLVAFCLGRTLLKPKIEAYMDEYEFLRVMNAIIEHDGWKFAFIMRLSPLIPNEPLNYACSLTSMSFKHMAMSSFGSLPKSAYEVWLSAQAADSLSSENSGELNWQFTVALNVVILLLMVLWCIVAMKKYHYAVQNIV
jgi:uncharacterized membrane protein YdjX (TVP38/TMEM64 family)